MFQIPCFMLMLCVVGAQRACECEPVGVVVALRVWQQLLQSPLQQDRVQQVAQHTQQVHTDLHILTYMYM